MAKQKSRFPSYGLVRGPSHERGGVAGMVAGEQPVELEGGEWIIPKEAVPDYLPVLKQITNEGRAMQQMQNGNSAMDALIASASMEAGISEAKSPMFQDGGQIKLRKQQTKLPYQDGAPYVGTDKIDDVIDIINSMSSNQVGGFGQTLNPVGYYDMPEAGRLSKKSESQLSDAGYNKYAGDEEMETSTKAAIMFDLLQRGQYNNDLNALRQDFLKSDVRNISPQKEQGGMVDEYEGGGQLHSRRMYNQKDKKKYGYEMGGMMPEYQDGGEINFEKITDLAKLYGKKQGIELNPEYFTSEGGRSREGYKARYGLPEGFTIDTLQYASPSNYSLQFNAPDGERLGTSKSSGILDIIGDISKERAMSPKSPNLNMREYFQQRKEAMELEKMFGELARQATLEYPKEKQKEQGGMIKQYQQGGQMQPRKQQEIRNPHMYGSASGSPAFLPSSSPDTTSESLQQILDQTLINPETYGPPDSLMGPDTTSGDLNELLEYYKESERRNQLNALTGDTLDPQLDSLRLLQRMQKSKMPADGRKNMQQGGPVMYQQGGQVLGKGQPLSSEYQKRADEFVQYDPNPAGYAPLANQTMPGALLGSIGSDKRIKPLRSDTYIKKMPLAKTFDPSNMNYGLYQEEVEEVPKLSTAYLASFGMETPLSRNQSRLLFRKGIAPDTLNPKVKGLINRALVQRLANEED